MAYLTKLNNPFDLLDKETHTIGSGVAVFYYLNTEESDIEFVVSINGEIIEDYTYVIKDEDHLAFVAIPKGGGGGSKNVLRTVAMIAVAIAAPFAAPMVLGAMGVAATSLTLAVASTALVVAGGMIINSLLPVPQPSLGTSSSLENVSPTYSFSGGSNATASGTVLPIMLGEARVTPPIIGSYISLDGDKQYLNLLMAVNDGLVDDITDIEINGQPIDNFNDVTYSKTLGSHTQGVIGNFRDSHTTVSLQRGLDEQGISTTYTTQGNSVQELEVVMLFPQGLYYVDDNGNYQRRSVEFEIAYKNVNDSEWNYITREVIDYDYIYSDGSTEYTYDTYQGQYVRVDDDYGWYKNLTYSRKVVVSTTTVNTQLVSNIFKTTKRLAYTIKELPKGQYDIRVTRVSSYDTNTRVANSLTLDYVNEVVYDDFTYPGVALLSVNAMATDQLNGGIPTITCKCTNIGADKKKNNPAWACYDLLKREGIDDTNIDLVKFQEWADYCDSKNLKCGLYLDSQQELQSALNMVSLLGRATVVQFGSTFAPIIDKVVDIPTQSFLFTSGNIIESSFSLDYIPYDDRSNVVEVTYYDEDDGYKAKIVQVQAHDYDTTTAEKKSSISLYGCTNQQQAANYAQFLLNNNRYITETVSFTASIDAIACSVGDVIKVGKKYMTNTIADGRIVSATETTITLDQEVFLTAGESYELQIRLQDDAIITVDVPAVSSDTLTDTLTVNTLATLPQQFDVFAFGLQTLEAVNLYRVVNITRDSDLTRKIKAIEYNPDVYNDSAVVNVESVLVVDDISNLAAVESLVKNADGSVDEVLTLNWVGTSSGNAVYVNGSYHGTAYSNEYLFKNELVQNEQYVFKVGNSEISHLFLGKSEAPKSVKNIQVNWSNGKIIISWDRNNEVDLSHYEILIDGRIYVTQINSLTVDNLDIGDYLLQAHAVDTSSNKSEVVRYNLHVSKPCMIYMIRDAYLIEKAFIDGSMTIYTSFDAPIGAKKYDIWKVDVSNVTLEEFSFETEILTGVTWETGSGSVELYKYYNGSEWILCTTEQTAVVKRMLGQLTTAGINDNEVKVYNVTPYTPYDTNDLWINGREIYMCTTARTTGDFNSTDWELQTKEDITIASKIENIRS